MKKQFRIVSTMPVGLLETLAAVYRGLAFYMTYTYDVIT